MGFEATVGGVVGSSDGVDYTEFNKYMVDTCKLQDTKTVVGIISGIIDLGMQEQPDAEMEFNGSPAQEADELAKGGTTYFKTVDNKRYKCWKKKPTKSIAITVDIPSIIVDKGQFFSGDKTPNPQPLRMILNSSFYRKEIGCTDLGRLFNREMRKNEKTNNQWSINYSNLLYKMAVGAGIIKQNAPFLPEDIIKLLGVPLLFKVQIYMNPKGYYTEKIAFAAGLIEGMPVPQYDRNLLYSVGFDSNNDDKAIQFLSAPIRNRMQLSSEYPNSKVKVQIERIHTYQKSSNDKASSPTPVESSKPASPAYDEDSIPF